MARMIKQPVNIDCFYDCGHKIKQLKRGRICLCLWLQLVQPMAVWAHVLLKNTGAKIHVEEWAVHPWWTGSEEKERCQTFNARLEQTASPLAHCPSSSSIYT